MGICSACQLDSKEKCFEMETKNIKKIFGYFVLIASHVEKLPDVESLGKSCISNEFPRQSDRCGTDGLKFHNLNQFCEQSIASIFNIDIVVQILRFQRLHMLRYGRWYGHTVAILSANNKDIRGVRL